MSKPGYIYVITGEGYAKIGMTQRNPKYGRLQDLQHTCPFDLSIFVTRRVGNVRREEMRLHRKYQEWRARGEWFKLEPQQLVEIHQHVLSLKEVPSERFDQPRPIKIPTFDPFHGPEYGLSQVAIDYRDNTGPFSPEEMAKTQ